MTKIGISIVCVLLLTVSSIDGFGFDFFQQGRFPFESIFLQKMFPKKIGPADIKFVDPIYVEDLEYLMNGKKTHGSLATNSEQKTGDEKLYLVKVVDNQSPIKLPGIPMRNIIVAPIHCPRGYKMDTQGKCRLTL